MAEKMTEKDSEFCKAYEALEAEQERRRDKARLRVRHQIDMAKALDLTVEQLVEELFSVFPHE